MNNDSETTPAAPKDDDFDNLDVDDEKDEKKKKDKKHKKKSKDSEKDKDRKHRDSSKEKDKDREKELKEKLKEKQIEKRHRSASPIGKDGDNGEESRKRRTLSPERDRDRKRDEGRSRRSPSPRYRRRSPSYDRRDRDSRGRRYDSRDRDRERDRTREKDKEKDNHKEKINSSTLNAISNDSEVKTDTNEPKDDKTELKLIDSDITDNDKKSTIATDKDNIKEKDKEKDRSKDKRDRSPDRDTRRRRSPSPRHRRRSPSYDRRDRDSRGRRYDSRDRDRDRYRDRSSDRDRRSSKRDRSSDRNSGGDSSRKNGDKSPDRGDKPRPLTLKDIITAYPGISIAEAAQRLNAHNSALAMGLPPPSQTSLLLNNMGGLNPTGSTGFDTNIPGLGNQLANPLGTGMGGLVGEGGALTKPHRELYVGNIPPGTTVPQLADFLNAIMKQLNLTTSPSGCVVTAWVSTDGHYAFVEFRTIEETLAGLQYLNGLQVGAHVLKVGRPKGYNPNGPGNTVGVSSLGVVPTPTGGLMGQSAVSGALGSLGALTLGSTNLSTLMNSGSLGGLAGGLTTTTTIASTLSNVIMVTNIPLGITEDQIKELVSTFGQVKAFNLIKTADTSHSAVLEYVDKKVTDDAIAGLNKLEIANFRLAVQRVPAESAAILLQPLSSRSQPSANVNQPGTTTSATNDPLDTYPSSRILRLSNMTVDEDLTDDELYQELREDIHEECSKYGELISLEIPRLAQYGGSIAMENAVGFIFLQYSTEDGAKAAQKAVAGRSFNGKIVKACFYPEDLYSKKIMVLPPDYLNNTLSLQSGGPMSSAMSQPTSTTMADPDSYFNEDMD